jgi:GAF domain-containing protein
MSETGEDTRVRALLRLAREVTARHDLEDVLAETFRELRTVVSFDGGSIQLIDDDGWITVAACDPPAADALQARVPLGNSVAGRVVLTEQAIYVPDVQRDGRALLLPSTDWTDSVRSYLAVPLLADGRAIGLLRIDSTEPEAFDNTEQLFLVAAAVMVAAAIQNARAQAKSTSARARVEALEYRIDQMRGLLTEARVTSTLSEQEVKDLLRGLERELGAAETTIAVDTASTVTL